MRFGDAYALCQESEKKGGRNPWVPWKLANTRGSAVGVLRVVAAECSDIEQDYEYEVRRPAPVGR